MPESEQKEIFVVAYDIERDGRMRPFLFRLPNPDPEAAASPVAETAGEAQQKDNPNRMSPDPDPEEEERCQKRDFNGERYYPPVD